MLRLPGWSLVVALGFVCILQTQFCHAQETDKNDAIFGLTKVNQLHLELSADAWKKMQPPAPRFPGGPPGFGPGFPKASEKNPEKSADIHKSAGAFGTEFPWVRVDLTANGTTFKNVGVRYKGNFTYL